MNTASTAGSAQHLVDRSRDPGAELGGGLLGRLGDDVVARHQLGARVRLDVAGVHPADAAAAEHGETNHLLPASLLPLIRLLADPGFDTRQTKSACACLEDSPVTLEYDFEPDATANFQFFYGTKRAFHFPPIGPACSACRRGARDRSKPCQPVLKPAETALHGPDRSFQAAPACAALHRQDHRTKIPKCRKPCRNEFFIMLHQPR
jgi:hypothetical protein